MSKFKSDLEVVFVKDLAADRAQGREILLKRKVDLGNRLVEIGTKLDEAEKQCNDLKVGGGR
jgi:hypothetical protein